MTDQTSHPAAPESPATEQCSICLAHPPYGDCAGDEACAYILTLERQLELAQTEIKGHMRVEDELKAELQIVQPKAQVMHDLHDALGVKWGCDPYAEIRRLKRFEKFCEELLAQNTEAQARIAELEKDWETDADYVRMAERIKELEKLLQGWDGYCWKDGEYIDDVQEFFDAALKSRA